MNDLSMGSSIDSFTANLNKSFSKFSIEPILPLVNWTFLSKMSGQLSLPIQENSKKERSNAATQKSSGCNFLRGSPQIGRGLVTLIGLSTFTSAKLFCRVF
jgi:hypothetical protein